MRWHNLHKLVEVNYCKWSTVRDLDEVNSFNWGSWYEVILLGSKVKSLDVRVRQSSCLRLVVQWKWLKCIGLSELVN